MIENLIVDTLSDLRLLPVGALPLDPEAFLTPEERSALYEARDRSAIDLAYAMVENPGGLRSLAPLPIDGLDSLDANYGASAIETIQAPGGPLDLEGLLQLVLEHEDRPTTVLYGDSWGTTAA